jgi:hypothetical protein
MQLRIVSGRNINYTFIAGVFDGFFGDSFFDVEKITFLVFFKLKFLIFTFF